MRFTLPSSARAAISCLAIVPCLCAATNHPPGFAQAPIIRSWGTEAGLPQNTVTTMVQTRDGYLWLGTHDGLARFDGVRFKVFGLEEGLPSVDILCLFEDHQGVLWIGTDGAGLCYLRQGRIQTIADPSLQPSSHTIACLQEDSRGRLWVGSAGGLRFCQDGQLKEEAALAMLRQDSIRSLERSQDGKTMWIATGKTGLVAFRNGRLEPCPGPAGNEKIRAHVLFADRQGRLWVSVGNGMVLCRQQDSWRVFHETDGLPFAYVTCLAEDADGSVWAGSLDEGLYRFDGSRFEVLRRGDGLSADDIRSLYCDREGDLWVGTRTGGLDRLTRRRLEVVGYAQGLTNDFTRSVAETADGDLWVGTVGGSLFRGGLSGFKPFRPEPVGSLVYYFASVDPVLATPDGGLWWGGAGSLLLWKDNHLAACFTNEAWLQNVTLTALQNDGRGGIWIGTSGGQLEHWQDGHFTEFPQQIARATITSLAVEPDGSLWVGSVAGGIKRIREGSDTVLTVAQGLSSESIRTLYRDGQGILWIGTAGGGLNCWRDGRVCIFTAGQGLTPRTVSQIVEDDHGFLWLGCNSGIFKVSKTDLINCAAGKLSFVHARSFGPNDGMPASECSGGFCPAGLKTKSGLICMSTVKGLVFLDSNEPRDETPPPKVLLEEVVVNGRAETLALSEAGPPRLVLPPGNRDMELHYTANEFSAPEKIGFRYKLEGIDRAWTEAATRRTVYYQNLPPGDFTFHVQACNASGQWNAQDTSLAVSVRPFFWETGLFRATAALVLLALISGVSGWILRRRYKHRLARLRTLNAIERERLRISKDMHDHIGGVLTQVSQLSDMGLVETQDKALVKSRFERIGDRARAAVQALDEIVWATNPKNDNLANFVEYVSQFSDEFFECTHMRCWQDVPASFPAMPLRADVRHNVFLAVREAFNNALKHSHGTEVWLRMNLEGGRVTLEIDDNGCGFTLGATAAGGNGLENMRARLAEEGGQTEVTSAPGKGTRIRFIFPVTAAPSPHIPPGR